MQSWRSEILRLLEKWSIAQNPIHHFSSPQTNFWVSWKCYNKILRLWEMILKMWCAYEKYLRAKNKVTSYFKNLYKTSFVLSIESKKTYAIESLFFWPGFQKEKEESRRSQLPQNRGAIARGRRCGIKTRPVIAFLKDMVLIAVSDLRIIYSLLKIVCVCV